MASQFLQSRKSGYVYTFYSYKGGVGRSMALANTAALLAKWGRSVLVVDWDLEASGIERFFLERDASLPEQRAKTPGVVDLIEAKAGGTEIDWRKCLLKAYPFGVGQLPVTVITAGRDDDQFKSRVQALDFESLFANHDLGNYIEKLRKEWTSEYDIVLVDSRTGITDIGGICTIHLPDVLVLLFTTTESSVNGVLEVIHSAREQLSRLPFDRRGLLALPVPARDESRTEYENAREWRGRFAERFAEFYRDWLPTSRTPLEVLDRLKIPYIPFWSFGERLPVVEDSTGDLAAAYDVLARLMDTDLQWDRVLSGAIIQTPVRSSDRTPDSVWLEKHRGAAKTGIQVAGCPGSVEILFYSPNAVIDKPNDQLLDAARTSQIHTFGWPIGVILDQADKSPQSKADGIMAEVSEPSLGTGLSYDYWALNTHGDFYTLIDLFEDTRSRGQLFADIRIIRTAEALIYCSKLYRSLGVNGNTLVKFKIGYDGLAGRTLGFGKQSRLPPLPSKTTEQAITSEIAFLLSNFDAELVSLVRQLCEPLFLLFGFTRFDQSLYQQIVTDFRNGKI